MDLNREEWFVVRAKQPDVSARKLAQEYGLEELRHYIDRSRKAIDAMRGWRFAYRVSKVTKNSKASRSKH